MKKIIFLIFILVIVLYSLLVTNDSFSPSDTTTSAGEIRTVTVLPSGKVLVGQQ